MMFSPTHLRRYTPPTCTLQITAKASPLQKWTSRPLFQDARFELRFDDPRKLEHEQIILTGDRDQLETLYEVVSDYVQSFLIHSTPARLSAYIKTPANAPDLPLTEADTLIVPGLLRNDSNESKFVAAAPSLVSQGLLSHKLYFGNLANEKSGDAIELSATQLFDLAAALDDYNAEINAVPALKPKRSLPPLRTWGSAVAGTLFAVGLTAAVVTVMNNSLNDSQTAIAPLPNANPDDAISDLPTLPQPPVVPIPTPSVPENIAGGSQLPPPPPVSRSPVQVTPPTDVQTVPNSQANRPSTSLPTAPQVPVQSRAATPTTPSVTPRPSAELPSTDVPAAQSGLPDLNARSPNAPTTVAEALKDRQQANLENNRARGGTIPQVGQIQRYFQQNWQPPDNLEDKLEYRLVLNPDGSLQRIVPLSEVAGTFIDRTPMPLMGQPFGLSPLNGETTPQVRLSLYPDGRVETYLESTDG
jgi:hypothetical protein